MPLVTLGAASDPAMTLRQAAALVDEAIGFGELVAQRAPEGHRIFEALDDARDTRRWISDQIPMFSDGGPALPTVSATVRYVVDRVHAAAADVRNDPEAPLSPTAYAPPASSPPWTLIAFGGLAVVGAAIFFKRGRV